VGGCRHLVPMLSALALLACATSALQVHPLISSQIVPIASNNRRTSPRLEASSPSSGATDPFEEYPELLGALDELPVFTLANAEGQPLKFQVGQRIIAVFYADVEAAKVELAKLDQDLGCDLLTVGLGSAYRLACNDKGMVVPGLAELRALGAPEDAQPLGQELPLFACMEMTKEGNEGPVLPLFMSYADCAAAVAEASDAAEREDPLQITGLSLAGVVEDSPSGSFSFVPPSVSMEHITAYVGKGVYWRPVEEKA